MWRGFYLFVISLLWSCHSSKEVKERFDAASAFQLVMPKVITDSILFKKSANVELVLDFPEVEIRYTLDGSTVTRSSSLYESPFAINESATLRAVAFHPDCQASESLVQPFFKVEDIFEEAEVNISPMPDKRYAGKGLSSLTDFQKGSVQFRGDNRWLGFQKDTVDIQIQFKEKKKITSLTLSTLANESAWILFPGKIELLDGQLLFATKDKTDVEGHSEAGLHFITIEFPERTMEELTIRILSDPLPKGHNGYGYISWLFVDEVFVAAN